MREYAYPDRVHAVYAGVMGRGHGEFSLSPFLFLRDGEERGGEERRGEERRGENGRASGAHVRVRAAGGRAGGRRKGERTRCTVLDEERSGLGASSKEREREREEERVRESAIVKVRRSHRSGCARAPKR